MPPASPSLSALLPPLVFGCATFNTQYNADPYAIPATAMVARALELGVRAFDTAPYYGPSEAILGEALDSEVVRRLCPRTEYLLITKAGRLGASCFDYTPKAIRRSVARSLERLRTSYLDVVYCHDVEFVSDDEVLGAVAELRRLRDTTGVVRYVGIAGYPVARLATLAALVRARTGEPLDVVQTYSHMTLQNHALAAANGATTRLAAAGVSIVTHASILGMGLLRRDGLPVGAQGDWHPAPSGLRAAVRAASAHCDARGERLEKVAIRFALESWLHAGTSVGTRGLVPTGVSGEPLPPLRTGVTSSGPRRGVSVIGVSSIEELEETLRVWRSILDAEDIAHTLPRCADPSAHAWSVERRATVAALATDVRGILGAWADYEWPSPPADFVNVVDNEHGVEKEDAVSGVVQLPTPAASPGAHAVEA